MRIKALIGGLLFALGLGLLFGSYHFTWKLADDVFDRFETSGHRVEAVVESLSENVTTRTKKGVPFSTSSYELTVRFEDPVYDFESWGTIEHFVSGSQFAQLTEGETVAVLYEPEGEPELILAAAPEAGFFELLGMLAKLELNGHPHILLCLLGGLLLTPIGLAVGLAKVERKSQPEAVTAR